MSRKKRKPGQMSSTFKTCLIGAALFFVAGIGCVIYGAAFYHTDKMVTSDEIVTGVTATVTDVVKQDRNLSVKDREREEKNGRSEDEIHYEYLVSYAVEDNGNTYSYERIEPYSEKHTPPKIGDTDVINYAIVDGEFIVSPETQAVNGSVITGAVLIFLSLLALGIGFFIRK